MKMKPNNPTKPNNLKRHGRNIECLILGPGSRVDRPVITETEPGLWTRQFSAEWSANWPNTALSYDKLRQKQFGLHPQKLP